MAYAHHPCRVGFTHYGFIYVLPSRGGAHARRRSGLFFQCGISNLGLLLHDKGDLAAAERLLREALKGRRDIRGSWDCTSHFNRESW